MQFKKLTPEQRRIKRWRERRNRLVSEILAGDKRITREEALRQANEMMRKK
jgi:hypothetical protein